MEVKARKFLVGVPFLIGDVFGAAELLIDFIE